ncbi:MAG: penicillin-binding transpeptidase domain-containing protein [Oscillospiraceae bacterium]
MERIIKSSRLVILAVILSVLLIIYGFTLYKLQIIEGNKYLEDSVGSYSTTQTIHAARGSILDRNGKLLVSDRTVYNVNISRTALLKQDDPNGLLLRLIQAAQAYDIDYNDTFPVTISAPFDYLAGATSSQQERLKAYFEYFDLDPDISASDLISWMRSHYGIDYTVTAEDARRIIGVRYELELRVIINTTDYIFAEDVSTDFITYISEQNFPSVTVETTSERQYHTTYAAHLLGYVRSMSLDEYNDVYKALGYPYNALVGKDGVEYAFEEYLHGTDGTRTTYRDSSGAVTNVEETPAQAGSNVYLTIDIDLQAKAEDALASTIALINSERTREDDEKAEGGAVVMLDVKSGDVLALASYPTYNLSTLSRDISSLITDESRPMWNRATQGAYNPGSTFKMVTALAGLRLGLITRWTQVRDEGIFTKYPSYQPRCWIWPNGTHGLLDVVGAIENSCNYFFYWLSDQMDIDDIAAVAREFGFGASTGIEIGDSAGKLATREYKMEVTGETGWWKADTLITAIGQGLNEFTPIQIANYIATIANGGTLYSTSVLKYITSSDYSDIILEEEPEVLSTISDEEGYISTLQEGMRAVASTGTASSVFADYPIPVAAKTGTTQSDTAATNTGVFVCYAPADDPEVAIAVVVEKGGSGSALTAVAKELLDVYFESSEVIENVQTDNSSVK